MPLEMAAMVRGEASRRESFAASHSLETIRTDTDTEAEADAPAAKGREARRRGRSERRRMAIFLVEMRLKRPVQGQEWRGNGGPKSKAEIEEHLSCQLF